VLLRVTAMTMSGNRNINRENLPMKIFIMTRLFKGSWKYAFPHFSEL